MFFLLLALSTLSFGLASHHERAKKPLTVTHEWKTIDYNWPSEQMRQDSIANGSYVPANNAISGVKAWRGQIYVTIPRLHSGVPVTLAAVPKSPISPKLNAFPNWAMQTAGDCKAIQLAQSMEIDTTGKMWVLDVGRVNLFDKNPPKSKCKPRLVIIDLTSHNFPITRIHEFSENVASPQGNYINDIVIDSTSGGFAYIADFGQDPGIIVYSYSENRSWKVKDDRSMTADKNINSAIVDGQTLGNDLLMLGNIDGIALSPLPKALRTDRTVYYSPLTSHDMFSISTHVLKNPPENFNVSHAVKYVGEKASITDGMVGDSKGNIYFGVIEKNEIDIWNPKNGGLTKHSEVYAQDNTTLIWPDGFGMDESGVLYIVTNKLPRVFTQTIDVNEVNFRILTSSTGAKSYMYHSFSLPWS